MANQMLGEMGIHRMSSSNPFSSELGNHKIVYMMYFCLINQKIANFGSAF